MKRSELTRSVVTKRAFRWSPAHHGTIENRRTNAVLVNCALRRILDLDGYVGSLEGEIGSDNIPVAIAAAEAAGAFGCEIVAWAAGFADVPRI